MQSSENEIESTKELVESDGHILHFLDSVDSYLLLMDSLSSALRQGWLDLASARQSMGVSRVNSTLLDLKPHLASTTLQVDNADSDTELPRFTLCKWASVRKAPNNIYTIELPKSLLDLNKDACSQLLKELPTVEDVATISRESEERNRAIMSQHLVQFLVYYGRDQSKTGTQVIHQLQADLEKKETEVLEATTRLAASSAESDALRKHNSSLTEQVSALEEDAAALRQQVANLRGEVQRLTEVNRTAHDAGYAEGVDDCRRRLLLTEVGQQFLKELHEGLLEEYRRSTLYIREMGPFLVNFVESGFQAAVDQATAQGFAGQLTCDLGDIAPKLKTPEEFEGDETLPVDHPWWMPVMRRASRNLARSAHLTPELEAMENPPYNLQAAEPGPVQISNVPQETPAEHHEPDDEPNP